MIWRIEALPLSAFQPLFDLDDDALLAIGARRMIADAPNRSGLKASLTRDPGSNARDLGRRRP